MAPATWPHCLEHGSRKAASSFASGADSYTFSVTGGNGEVSTYYGTIDLGGTLVVINAKTGKTVTVANLELNYFTGAITGHINGSTTSTTIANLGGDLSQSTSAGPPAFETFTADQLLVAAKGARALNTAPSTTAFARGSSLGTFTTTYDVTIS